MSKDLFSRHATQYAAFRPTYPGDLYQFIFSQLRNFDSAWDAGTGNGQVARDLSNRFKNIFATDISEKQIENAHKGENIIYSIANETTSFPDKSFDLICVAQAIHWFDREKFYIEVKRVAKPSALVAVWGYGLLKINSELDEIIRHFYVDVVGPYWDKERRLIDEEYKTISFPFPEIDAPSFRMIFNWGLKELQGYLTTWSAVQKFILDKKVDPVKDVMTKIEGHWKQKSMNVEFPLFTRIGTV